MSEDSPESSSSWWGGWIQTAKEKSFSMLNVVKQDLIEFSNVMQCDGSRVACAVKEKINQETAATASEKVKQGMSSFLGGLSKALIVLPEDDDDSTEMIRVINGKPVIFDRAKAQLYALQTDTCTYTVDPALTDERFSKWVESHFILEDMKVEISDLLVSNTDIRSIYTQLVPLTVSNVDFWKRYFYKKHLFEEEENRRSALMKRAQETSEDEDLGWDEEEDVSYSIPAEPQNDKTAEASNTSKAEAENSLVLKDSSEENAVYPIYCLKQDLVESPLVEKPNCTTKKETEESKRLNSKISAKIPIEKFDTISNDLNINENKETHSSENNESKIDTKQEVPDGKFDIDETKKQQQFLDKLTEKFDKVSISASRSPSSATGTNESTSGSLADDWEKDFEEEVKDEQEKAPSKVNKEEQDQNNDWEEW